MTGDRIQRIARQFCNRSINTNELRQNLICISNNPTDNKHNLGKAFQGGLSDNCSKQRAKKARGIVQEVDPEIYQGAKYPYNCAFGDFSEED
jgi:hypothetical protein